MKTKQEKYYMSFVQLANKRAGAITNTSFFNDIDWEKAQKIVYKKGPINSVDMVIFKSEHDRFARLHLMDFVFECESLYRVISSLQSELAKYQDDKENKHDK